MTAKRADRSDSIDNDPTVRAILRLLKEPTPQDVKTFDLWLLNVAYVLESTPELENLARALPAQEHRMVSRSQTLVPPEVEQVERVLNAALERLTAPFGPRWSDAQLATMKIAAEKVVREAVASPGVQDAVRAMLQERANAAVSESPWITRVLPTVVLAVIAVFLGGTAFGVIQLNGVTKTASESQTAIAKVASESQSALVTAREDALNQVKLELDKVAKHQANEISNVGRVAQQKLTNQQRTESTAIDGLARSAKDDLQKRADALRLVMEDGKKSLTHDQELTTALNNDLTRAKNHYETLHPAVTKLLAVIPQKIDTLSKRRTDLRNMETLINAVLYRKPTFNDLMADLNSAASARNVRIYSGQTTYASWECLTLIGRCSLFIDLDAQATAR